MDKNIIYVVMGETGEYSDRREWPVCAFSVEEDAQGLVKELKEKLLELKLSSEQEDNIDKSNAKLMEEYDPGFDISYTGSRYYYFEVDYYYKS